VSRPEFARSGPVRASIAAQAPAKSTILKINIGKPIQRDPGAPVIRPTSAGAGHSACRDLDARRADEALVGPLAPDHLEDPAKMRDAVQSVTLLALRAVSFMERVRGVLWCKPCCRRRRWSGRSGAGMSRFFLKALPVKTQGPRPKTAPLQM
jgi:hypothetical protein